MSNVRVQEALSLLDEVARVFQSGEDVEKVRRFRANGEDIRETSLKKEDQIKSAIKELTGKRQQLRAQADDPPAAQLRKNQDEVLQQKDKLHVDVSVLEMRLTEQQQRVRLVDGTHRDVATRMENERASSAVEVPAIRSTLQLYHNISNISWDYESRDVKGVLHMVHAKEVRPFHIKPAESGGMAPSRVAVADTLWDMMWEDQASAASAAAAAAAAAPHSGSIVIASK